jgi:hypothetical protein
VIVSARHVQPRGAGGERKCESPMAIFNFSSLGSARLTRVVPSLSLAIVAEAQQPLSWNLSRVGVTPLSRREAARREKSHEQVSADSNSVAQNYWRGLGLAEIDLVHGKVKFEKIFRVLQIWLNFGFQIFKTLKDFLNFMGNFHLNLAFSTLISNFYGLLSTSN